MAEDVEMTPISPAEGGGVPPKVAPFGGEAPAPTPPAPAAPKPHLTSAAVSASPGLSTIKLKPVIRKPTIHKPVVGARPAPPASAPKAAAPNLKSVTGPIPAQATLKKTGIIAEGIITPQQQQAAKSKTSRISLESAIGVAPAKEGPAPLKTIRLRRPTDLKPAPLAPKAEEKPAEPAAPIPAPAAPADEGVTQKRTLKLHRPGGIALKPPAMNLGGTPGEGAVADLGAVPELGAVPSSEEAKAASGGVPTWLAALSLTVAVAALLVLGCLVYTLVEEGRHATGAGANETAFLSF